MQTHQRNDFRSFLRRIGNSLMGNLLARKCKFIEIDRKDKDIYKKMYYLEKRDYSFADFVHIQTARKKGLKMVSFDKHLTRSKIFHWSTRKNGKKIKRLYLDASALIPLIKWEGSRTEKMQKKLFNNDTQFYISNFTISETYNVLNR